MLRLRPLSPENTERALLASHPELEDVKRRDPELFSDVIMSAGGSAGLAAELLVGKEAARISAQRRASEKFCALASDSTKGAELMIHLSDCCGTARESATEQLESFSLALRDLALLKKDQDAPLRFFTDRDAALELCDSFSLRRLLTISDAVEDASRSLGRNMNVRLTLLSMLSAIGYIA